MKFLVQFAAATLTMCSASQVFAVVVTTTYKGELTNFVDYAGIFSNPGSQLSGKSFKIVHVYDDYGKIRSCDQFSCYSYSQNPNRTINNSGIEFNLFIDNVKFSMPKTDFIYAHNRIYRTSSESSPPEINNQFVFFDVPEGGKEGDESQKTFEAEVFIYNNSRQFFNNIDYRTPFKYKAAVDDVQVLNLAYYMPQHDCGQGTSWCIFFENSGLIRNMSVEVQVAGVPEPRTWSMLIIGIGAVGTISRRQRRRSGLA